MAVSRRDASLRRDARTAQSMGHTPLTLPNANAAPEWSGAARMVCERSVTLINAGGGRPQDRPGQAAPESRASEHC